MDYISPKIRTLLEGNNKKIRKFICQQSFLCFALYYFSEYFTYKPGDFHFEMSRDLENLRRGKFDYLMWVMFRESAKTTFARIYAVYCICFRFKRYINWDSYNKDNSEAALFDITQTLQSNKKLISDFGNLYWEKRTNELKTLKRITEFITVNGIKVEAFSTQESTRGRIYKKWRPDLHILDDFETSKTKDSSAITKKIREHIDEMMAGLPAGANVMFLCNLITEAGVVKGLMDQGDVDPKFFVRRVDAEAKGKPAWPAKYTKTDAEAIVANKGISDPTARKVSLEAKKRTLNASGHRVYEVEMLNSPEAAGDLLFDRKTIDRLIAKARDCKEDIANFKIWFDYNPSHRYAIGADTSAGIGRDSNASILMDYTSFPNRVVGIYKSNSIAPDIFAHELKRQGNLFGQCLIAPERNNTGYATITELKRIYPVENIWRRISPGKVHDKPDKALGWETTAATKPDMLYKLKSAVEDGQLEIFSLELLKEMRAYSLTDLQALRDNNITRHFDLVIAAAIAWAMRDYAEMSAAELKKKDYVQPAYDAGPLEKNTKDLINIELKRGEVYKSDSAKEEFDDYTQPEYLAPRY